MRCEKCDNYSSRSDSYCRRCGAEMPYPPGRNTRLPVKRNPTSPTVWSQAAPVLARGAALVALGVAAEVVLNTLAKGALRLPTPTRRGPAKTRAIATRRNGELPAGSYTVSETVVMRKFIFRR